MGHSQQMQVVVAQQALRSITQGHQAAQHSRRVGATVHQITQNDEGVAAGREIEPGQKATQRLITTLNVANQVKCHVFILASVQWNFC
jgi:hypothetical protein